jgi:hypothetical protein
LGVSPVFGPLDRQVTIDSNHLMGFRSLPFSLDRYSYLKLVEETCCICQLRCHFELLCCATGDLNHELASPLTMLCRCLQINNTLAYDPDISKIKAVA